ncbi:MAG: nucleotidyltransferase family protein [Betaproteobacteria bacterium]|jgi:MurNAc alpha-1-phosphate uridylyltransferase|nr:MAG: nucleotidyltransferase family protein [Betaproteobacteria bacterium]TMH84142.1 MAG: nucleotidyltransferase family protein [Betaproteobacteria bacterium]
MKAMILAAGRGERMRPLTEAIPKVLLEVRGKSLIAWSIEALARSGVREIVINHAHLGHMIEAALRDGRRFGVAIRYSREAEALETAGGIAQALPLLGDKPFLVVNGDLFCDFDFSRLVGIDLGQNLAHLVLVPNPPHHPLGDFALNGAQVAESGQSKLTYSGIGLYRAELFSSIRPGSKGQIAPLLRAAMAREQVSGEMHRGVWHDVGTPARLSALNERVA